MLYKNILSRFCEEDGANLINLLKENNDTQLVVIICHFITSVVFDDDVTTYIKYYELISTLSEIGYDNYIIDVLNKIGYILYK